eukprot:6181562-Pleurochrysis_carterae.AAC.7
MTLRCISLRLSRSFHCPAFITDANATRMQRSCPRSSLRRARTSFCKARRLERKGKSSVAASTAVIAAAAAAAAADT